MWKRTAVVLCVLMTLSLVSTGCSYCGEDMGRVNKAWYDAYETDRRPTASEAEEYAKLDDAQKAAWEAAGKPVLIPMADELHDAAKQMHDKFEAEAKAKE